MRTTLLHSSNRSASTPAPESIAEGAIAATNGVDVQRYGRDYLTSCQNPPKPSLSPEEGNRSGREHGSITPEASNSKIRPPLPPFASSLSSPSTLTSDEAAIPHPRPPSPLSEREKQKAVRWRDLPRKGQLFILTLARLSEPLTQTSLQSYMFYQLRSFDPSLSDSAISSQVGVLQGCFTAAQFVTAVMWGRISDSEWGGRKRVLLVGLVGTGVSCVGFGFSRSFAAAVVWRTLGGGLNGNVGVMKTMISEIIVEKRFQTRAFLLMPMCFNVGVIIGPMLGGILADPVGSYPSVFGGNSLIGGEHGVWWLKHWPYALPNLISAIFLFLSALAVTLGLEETLESIEGRPDWGLTLSHSMGNLYRRIFTRRHHTYAYTALDNNNTDYETPPNSATHPSLNTYELESAPLPTPKPSPKPPKPRPPIRSILTRPVLTTLLCHGLLAFHLGTFNSLWFIFLSTPRSSSSSPISLPFHFTGGLALPPPTIGLALAILGCIGLPLQLCLYPLLTARWSTLTCWRLALLCFPVTCALAPYLAVVPTASPSPHPADGTWVWVSLVGVLAVQVLGRTFALPGAIILVNNSAPSRGVLGTVHGVAQSVSSGMRAVGPVTGAWGFGRGLEGGVVGGVWWALAGWAVLGVVAGGWVVEGGGVEGQERGREMDVGEGEGEKDGEEGQGEKEVRRGE